MVKLFTAAARFKPEELAREKNIPLTRLGRGRLLGQVVIVEYNPMAESEISLKFNPAQVVPGEVVGIGISLTGDDWVWDAYMQPVAVGKINIRFNPYMMKEPALKFADDTLIADLGASLPVCFEITSENLSPASRIFYRTFLTADRPMLAIKSLDNKIAAEHRKFGILVQAPQALSGKEVAPIFKMPIEDPNAKELFIVCEAWTGESNSLILGRECIKVVFNKPVFADVKRAKKKLGDMHAVVKDICEKIEQESSRDNLVAALKKGSARFSSLLADLERLDAQMKKKFLEKSAKHERYTLATNLYQYEEAAIEEFEKRVKQLVDYSRELDAVKIAFARYLENKAKQFWNKTDYPVAGYFGHLSRQPNMAQTIKDSILQFNRANQFVSFYLPVFDQEQYPVAMERYGFEVPIAILNSERFSLDHLDKEMLRKNAALLDLIRDYHKKKNSIPVEQQESIIEQIDKEISPGFDYDIHSGSILANVRAMAQICEDLQKAIADQLNREKYLLGLLDSMIKY